MSVTKLSKIILWTARIWGGLILAITVISSIEYLQGRSLPDWKGIVLIIGNIIGLSIAYKWEAIGGSIVVLGLMVSGFLHPLVIPPGVLYILYWYLMRRTIRIA